MSNPSIYRSKPKKRSSGGGFMWFLIILLCGGIGWGGYHYYQSKEKQRLEEIQKQKDAKEKQRLELEKIEQERLEKERKLAELERQRIEELKKKEEEERLKAEELAKQQAAEEERKKKEEEERLKAEEEERLRREKEQDDLNKDDQPEDDEDKSTFPKPVVIKLPDLKEYTPESKDSIPMDKDKVLGTWSWSQAPKFDEISYFPTASTPWTDRSKAVEMAETYKKWRELDAGQVKASPSANDFPGVPQDGAELVERTVVIDSSIGGWHSTGLYAPPGAEISFQFTGGSFKDTSTSVRIGCHTDSLIHDKVNAWRRLPIMGNTAPVTKSRVSLADPSGGLVYICIGNANKHPKTFKVKISGATPAPLYIMGETTEKQWDKQLETTKAPWGEIRTPRLIFTLSLEQLKKCEKIKEVSEVLQKAMGLQDWIAGWDDFPSRIKNPMRFVVDRQISVGSGHSGYPAMGYMDWGNSITSGSILTSGDWGLWHELGHNHQGNPFAMQGQTEVSVNIFSMVCQSLAVGLDPTVVRGMSPSRARYKMAEFLADSSKDYNASGNDLQLFLWGELMYHFGPEPFREVHKLYHKKPFKDKVTDEEKWNWVMRAFGTVLKKDLTLYFETWKLPLDNATRAHLKRFPKWKPTETYPAPSYLEDK